MKANSSFLRLLEIQDRKEAERKGLERPTEADFPAIPGGTTVVESYHQPTSLDTAAIRGTTATTDSTATTKTTATTDTTGKWSRPNLAQLNLKIPKSLAEKFKVWCYLNRRNQTQAFCDAIQLLMAGDGSGGTTATTATAATTNTACGTTATTLLIDDFDDDDGIISLYESLTGNHATAADRQILTDLHQQHPDHIRVGILLSVLRSKKRINSLRYCIGAIEEAAQMSPQQTRDYLGYLRQKADQRRARS
jgi:hypothetical protein